MKPKFILMLLSVWLLVCGLNAQTVGGEDGEPGHVSWPVVTEKTSLHPAVRIPVCMQGIERSRMVDSLLLRHMDSRLKHKDEGYRILIFSQSGNHSKNAAIEAKANFEYIYPGYKAYISFEEPYFKVKVGNFHHRYDADIFLRTLKPDYPYAFIVKDVLDAVDYLRIGEEPEGGEAVNDGASQEDLWEDGQAEERKTPVIFGY